MITIRTLFLPLFLYIGIVTGYSLAEAGSLYPSVFCADFVFNCSEVSSEIFNTEVLSVTMFPPSVWEIKLADVLVLFSVITLVASGISPVRHTIWQPISVGVLICSVVLFVMHPLYSNSLFFILLFVAVMGLLHDLMKRPASSSGPGQPEPHAGHIQKD